MTKYHPHEIKRILKQSKQSHSKLVSKKSNKRIKDCCAPDKEEDFQISLFAFSGYDVSLNVAFSCYYKIFFIVRKSYWQCSR